MDRLTELLFKYSWPVFAKGELGLAHRPAWWVTVLLAAGLAALGYFFYTRLGSRMEGRTRIWLILLRGSLLIFILLLILRPVLVVTSVIPRSTSLGLLIDNSSSMQLSDEGGKPRIEAVRQLLTGETALAQRLSSTFHLRAYQFAGELGALPVTAEAIDLSLLTAQGAVSDPGGAIAGLLQETGSTALSAILLISDGAANRNQASGNGIEDLLRTLRSRGIPVFTVGVGAREGPPDFELTRITLPRRILIGSAITAELFVRRSGGLKADRLTVEISEDGRPLKSQNLDGRQLGESGDPQPLTVEFSPGSPGAHRYSFRLVPLDGEMTVENNVLDSLVEVTAGNPRILHLEGEPRWEYGKLRFSLSKNEKNVVLVSVLRSADGKFYRQGVASGSELTAGFPNTIEELFEYDGLVLGSIEANFFTYDQLRLIEQFVGRRGGGVLALGGRRAFSGGRYAGTPIAEILPLEIESTREGAEERVAGFKVRLTPRGRTHPVTRLNEDRGLSTKAWEELPLVTIPEQLTRLKPGATVILEATAAGSNSNVSGEGSAVPLLVEQRYGRGRTLALLASDTWRWRMELPSANTSHENFWRQLLRYQISTAPSRFEVTAERDVYQTGDGVTLIAELNNPRFEPIGDASIVAAITLPSGEVQELPLEPVFEERSVSYRASLTAAAPGIYRVSTTARRSGEQLGEASSTFFVSDASREFFDARLNTTLLKRIAAETGGSYYEVSQAKRLLAEITLLEGRNSERVARDLWDMPINFLLLIIILAAEWFLRKREGLV